MRPSRRPRRIASCNAWSHYTTEARLSWLNMVETEIGVLRG